MENIDVNIRDEDLRTPLHYAGMMGSQMCVRYLYEKGKGTSLSLKDKDGNTPLALAFLN